MARPFLQQCRKVWAGPPLGDWLRGALLVCGFAALGWLLLSRYSGSGRFEPHRRLFREFLRAAHLRDSSRLRTLVSSEQPLWWALNAAALHPWLLPDADSGLDIQGASHSGEAEVVAVWVRGACAQQPYFVTLVGTGRSRRIDAVRTACPVASTGDSAVKK